MKDDLFLLIACPFCGAGIEEPCTTRRGLPAQTAHTDRRAPIKRAFWAGYARAEEETFEFARRHPDAFMKAL